MPADQDISEYLAYLLASANRRMHLGLAQSIAPEEVTEEQWRVLQVLSDEQGRSMGELAERVLMNHPALTKNIDRLVSRGLVQRAADAQDNRRVLVYISDLGLEVVQRLKSMSTPTTGRWPRPWAAQGRAAEEAAEAVHRRIRRLSTPASKGKPQRETPVGSGRGAP